MHTEVSTIVFCRTGQTHELSTSHNDLEAEIIIESGSEYFSANAGFRFFLFEQIESELAQEDEIMGAPSPLFMRL